MKGVSVKSVPKKQPFPDNGNTAKTGTSTTPDTMPTNPSGLIRYGNGATRSAGTPELHLVPRRALTLIAERLARGAKTHGEWNWMRGMPLDAICEHIINHAWKLMHGEYDADDTKPDDHIGAIGAGMAFLADYAERHPEIFQGVTLPERCARGSGGVP